MFISNELELVRFLAISGNKCCHGNTLFNSWTYNYVAALHSELLHRLELISFLTISGKCYHVDTFLSSAVQRPGSGDYEATSKYACVCPFVKYFKCINLYNSFICEDIFTKIAENGIGYKNMCFNTFVCLFVYLGFYVAFNTVQVISRRVVGRAEETST